MPEEKEATGPGAQHVVRKGLAGGWVPGESLSWVGGWSWRRLEREPGPVNQGPDLRAHCLWDLQAEGPPGHWDL